MKKSKAKELIVAIKALEKARMCVNMSLKNEMAIHKILKKHYEPLGLKVSPFYESLDILLLGNDKIKELDFSYAIGKSTKKGTF